ncbi:hypothetical protein N2152v2_004634 [Parachlorella kessleri]
MELTIKTIAGNRKLEVDPHTTVAQLKVILHHEAASKLTPTSSQIDAAIREEVQRSPNPPGLDDASQRQRAQQAQRAQQQQELQALEDALAEGDLGALRAYLDQLQQVLREGGQASGSQRRELPAMLQSFLGAGSVSDALARAAMRRGAGEELGEEFGMEEEYTDEEYSGTEEEEEEEDDWEEEEEEEEDVNDEADSDEEGSDGVAEGSESGGARAAAAPLPPPMVPEVSTTNLASLQEMGFQEPLCRNALLLHRNHLSRALEWLIEHAEDPAAAEPLSEARLAGIYGRASDTSGSNSSSARRRGPTVDPSRLEQLVDMGFPAPQAEEALRTFNNSVEAACLQLINVGTTTAAASQPPSEQQQQQQGDSTTNGSEAVGEGSSASQGQEPESRSDRRASASGADEDDDVPSSAHDDGNSTDSGWDCWEQRPEAREPSVQEVAAAEGTAAPAAAPSSQRREVEEAPVQGTGPHLQGDLPSQAQQQEEPAEAAPSAMGAAVHTSAFAPEAPTALHMASAGRAGEGEEGGLEGVRSNSRLVLNGAKPSVQHGCQTIAGGVEATAGAAAKSQ